MAAVALTADFVEKIHDELVGSYFPGVEPVTAGDARDRSALESAVAAPFATACGKDAFPTIYEKAARLFYGIAANHPFSNGNKRTALVAADLFCYANSYDLEASQRTLVWAARMAASHNSRGISYKEALRRITRVFRRDMVPFAEASAHIGIPLRRYLEIRRWVRSEQRPAARPGRRAGG